MALHHAGVHCCTAVGLQVLHRLVQVYSELLTVALCSRYLPHNRTIC